MGRNKRESKSWDMIYSEFRKKHKTLIKNVLHWQPYDQDEIALYLSDKSIMVYNDETKRGRIIGSWGSKDSD